MNRVSTFLIAPLALALAACATPAPAGPLHMKGGSATVSGSYPDIIVTTGNQVAWDTRTTVTSGATPLNNTCASAIFQ